MDKYKLAEWLHDNYEELAKAENWQTQKITRVKFEDLPAENKATMLALADRLQKTFLIIGEANAQPHVSSNEGLHLPPIKKKPVVAVCDCSRWKRIWIEGKPMCSNCGRIRQ